MNGGQYMLNVKRPSTVFVIILIFYVTIVFSGAGPIHLL
jgi:hypothetical protein